MEELKLKLKEQLIEALNLEDILPEDIDSTQPLFGEGLGLDSIDALELIVVLEKEYGIKFADRSESRAAFASIDKMAEYVAANRKK
jgi:acyl carrier protein